MSFLHVYTIIIVLKGIIVNNAERSEECGIKPYRRTNKNSERLIRILNGSPTREGQYPWQVSLELLHPTMGFLGHWCGAVLIHENWVLSAAHCIHNDLFNLPLPPLWTVVLGEFDRQIESGYEKRIPVERIIMHRHYENFQHDLVLIKLSESADLGYNSKIRKICLPLMGIAFPQSLYDINNIDRNNHIKKNTYKSNAQSTNLPRYGTLHNNLNFSNTLINIREIRAMQLQTLELYKSQPSRRSTTMKIRRNDKYLHRKEYLNDQHASVKYSKVPIGNDINSQDVLYQDCIATGWGKSKLDGDLTNRLLQTKVPIQPNSRCKEAYGDTVKIHKGHLCGGKLNGKGGACVGDSGGPLQCRFTKDGPWILVGVTSFGSGCAEQQHPDVYTRITYYLKWILETISNIDEDYEHWSNENDEYSDYINNKRY